MVEIRTYRAEDLPGLVGAWNESFSGMPNFVRIEEADLQWRAFAQPSFDPRDVVVCLRDGRVLGFVHFALRTDLWRHAGERRAKREEGHIYVLVAPESEQTIISDLLGAAEEHLAHRGARRVLLGTSWIYGAQPYYNGIVGGYEIPGLSSTREDIISIATDNGYAPVAEYGTPELDLSRRAMPEEMDRLRLELGSRAREWKLELTSLPVESLFFPPRVSVELRRAGQVVATTAYGAWPEYARHYGRQLHGLTSVYVAPGWRGKGLGKLIVVEAVAAALRDGAEGVHLHVWRGNTPAWNLYHRALGFEPTHSWLTLEKRMR